MLNGTRGILFCLAFVCVLSIGQALPCLTTGSKKDFDKTRAALKGLESLLSSTVTSLQSQINNIKGKIKILDKDLIDIEDDFKRRRWMKYNDHCYYFGTESVTWTTAERQCREIGGYLAKIDDANENAWIYEKMTIAQKGYHYWVGMTDVVNGVWRWNYDETEPKYKNWANGHPYPASSSSSVNSNCMFLLNGKGTWHEYGCSYSTKYVCESNFCFA